jgi:hypothetical protein
MSSYTEDIRTFKRTKLEAKASWLVWRKGKFSPIEISSLRAGLEGWVNDYCAESGVSRDEALESLKWAKDHKMTAWCDIATRAALPDRKIGAIRHCVLRRMLSGSEKSRWTEEETAEFKRLQEVYGPHAWKQIAQETGRTLEDVANKGRQLEEAAKGGRVTTRFAKIDMLRVKLAKLVREGDEANPYELAAIRSDCQLVAHLRRLVCNSGSFEDLISIHEMPSGRLADTMDSKCMTIRMRWHQHIVPSVIRRVHSRLDDQDVMNTFLILQLRRACRGKLVDSAGVQVFPCHDWFSIDWKHLMPFWPQGLTETRTRHILRGEQRFEFRSLPEVVEQIAKVLLCNRSKSDVNKAAIKHFDEIRSILNIIADRGENYLAKNLS